MTPPLLGETGMNAVVMDALRSVYDPCCPEHQISVVDMGLIESVHLDGERATLELVLTSGWCPFATQLLEAVRQRVESLPQVSGVSVEVAWDKGWSAERLSAGAREKLRFLPDPRAVGNRDAYVAARLRPGEGIERA